MGQTGHTGQLEWEMVESSASRDAVPLAEVRVRLEESLADARATVRAITGDAEMMGMMEAVAEDGDNDAFADYLWEWEDDLRGDQLDDLRHAATRIAGWWWELARAERRECGRGH